MSFKTRLATLAESVDKSQRLELWLQTEDGRGYRQLDGGDILTLTQLAERDTLTGIKIMRLDFAPRAHRD